MMLKIHHLYVDIIKLTNEWLEADTQHYKPESTYDPNSGSYNDINKLTKILNVNMAEIVKNQESMSSLKIDLSVLGKSLWSIHSFTR